MDVQAARQGCFFSQVKLSTKTFDAYYVIDK